MEKAAMDFLLLDSSAQDTIKNYLPDDSIVNKLSAFFSIFSDNSRLRIVSALAITKMCVNDLALVLEMNQTTVSHQLKILKMADAVKCERQGKIMFYSLSSDIIKEIMLSGVDHVEPEIG